MRARTLHLLLAFLAGCGQGGPGTIERETFIDAYVDLREAALDTPGGVLLAPQKEEVLRRHGVTEEDLLRFAEVHGTDIEYMAGVWDDVEARLLPDASEAPTP